MENENENKRKTFWIKFALWMLFACAIPVAFIGYRFDIFSKVGSLQLSGWGLIAIVIMAVFAFVVIKYIKAGFVEWSMTKQVISGVVKVMLPLGALLAICYSIMSNLEVFIQALEVVMVSEFIAIFVNPFPQWVWEKSKGRFESVVDYYADRFYNKRKGE